MIVVELDFIVHVVDLSLRGTALPTVPSIMSVSEKSPGFRSGPDVSQDCKLVTLSHVQLVPLTLMFVNASSAGITSANLIFPDCVSEPVTK